MLASEAIARSCNIYFYTLADRLGLPALRDGLARFGLGQAVGTPLYRATVHSDEAGVERTRWVGESSGTLPSDKDIEDLRASGQLRFDTVIMGIGQGKISWTPLQAANAYALLARDGAAQKPALVLGDAFPQWPPDRAPLGGLDLPRGLVDATLEGLRQSVEEAHGTGYGIPYEEGERERIFNAPGVTVWGKTGTAQAPPWWIDRDGDGVAGVDELLRDLDHSWFVGLVGLKGAPRPLYAIAVIVEYGGSGGRVSGPVANQIIRALQKEGYLPEGDES
jgi:penicillin-binding protein 2